MVNVFVTRDSALNTTKPAICFCDENNRLLELYFDESQEGLSTNSIYVGEIKEKISSLNALRVSFGNLGEAFCNCKKEVYDSVKGGQKAIFQVKRLAFIDRKTRVNKLAEVSFDWEIAFEHIVLTSQCGQIGISTNITKQNTRDELRLLAQALDLRSFGLIFRTSSTTVLHSDLVNEIASAKNEIDAFHAFENAPLGTCLYEAKPFWKEQMIKYKNQNLLSKVYLDDSSLKVLVSEFEPTLYAEHSLHMLDFFRISPQIEDALRTRLDLKNGGYVIFENTNAFYAVDVNSSMHFSGKNREESILNVNLEAAELIMHQLKIRNIAGGVVIDFINMTNPQYIELLKQKVVELAKLDPIHISVYDFTRLFHLELARQHQGLSLKENIV